MPFDSNGIYTRIHNWEDDRQNDISIVSDRHDEEDDGFAEALSECLLKDGRTSMKGDLKMGGFFIKNLADGSSINDAVNKGQLDSLRTELTEAISSLINSQWKLGDIKPSLQSRNHGSWFICNGQAISRTEYAELFALIGTKFGSGNGMTTFNLPDYRGKFLRGLGGDSASDFQTTQAEGLPNITGTIQLAYGNGYINKSSAFSETVFDNGVVQDGGDYHDGTVIKGANVDFKASNSNSIYGASNHVTPINQAVNFFIKVKEV